MRPNLLDPRYAGLLPTPLAATARALADETAKSGVHTTADELVNCIEAFFGLVGRLWVAEYLAAGAPDAAANARLHGLLVTASKDPLMGAWLGVGRALRSVFVARGLRPVAEGLLDLTFGELGDDDHPVARLSAYRNSFAHGSFHSVVEDIVAHRALLEDLLAGLPFLTAQPILLDDGGTVLALRGETPESASRPTAPLTPHHPTLVGDDGRAVDLWPLALGKDADGVAGLCWTTLGKSKRPDDVSPRTLAKHAAFAIWAERYQRELDGDVEASATCLDGPPPLASQAPRGELEAAMARVEREGRCLVLVESPPGAPRSALLAHGASQSALRWRVTPGDLMGSGLVLVRAIARHAERRLGLAPKAIATTDAAAWRATLKDVASRCEAASVRLRLVIEDLHLGDAPARPGEPSVLEVWRQLASGPWTAIGGAARAWSSRPVAWDARVEVGWDAGVEASEVRRFLEVRGARPLHRRVLAALLAKDGGADLFAVCDALEAETPAETAFEPAVERALWDLAPVLQLTRAPRGEGPNAEEVRVFAPMNKEVLRVALTEVAAS